MKKLVRDGHHMRPMLAVLRRYGIGEEDGFGRGRWIEKSDLQRIEACMWQDEHRIEYADYGRTRKVCVPGTCRHNHVGIREFARLWG